MAESYRKYGGIVLLGGFNISNLWQVGCTYYDMSGSDLGEATYGYHMVVLGTLLSNKGKVISPSDYL
ncbi:hypothetical protein DXT99_17195 [Pontibacter diazotrophicus]|uniref:Uncharacterized protein n=1 Tax=Pontibacter diazotrophicus TaxID=1400979 RepID=A0A3D8L8P0_9BACT|nr:hypothetical protein [Pontibacter diazotrophicus]RDV13775.1 hypothetical protein DXT99_17195 [Pontibacter diazotrophicus]